LGKVGFHLEKVRLEGLGFNWENLGLGFNLRKLVGKGERL
jgi:hypothetical protein